MNDVFSIIIIIIINFYFFISFNILYDKILKQTLKKDTYRYIALYKLEEENKKKKEKI